MGLVIVGAGGLGREVLDVALALDVDVLCFADDARAGSVVRGVAVRHPRDVPGDASFLVGVADPVARRRLTDLLASAGCRPVTLVHPRAVVAGQTLLGAGCLVMAGAHVSSSVTVGAGSQVQYNATIGHDAVLDEVVTVLPGANVSGSVRIGAGATVGSGAVVLQGRAVGPGAFVGAGAVVTHDVAPGQVVVGCPARPLARARDSNHDTVA